MFFWLDPKEPKNQGKREAPPLCRAIASPNVAAYLLTLYSLA